MCSLHVVSPCLGRRWFHYTLAVALLIGFMSTPSHGYGVFQILRHVETGFDALDGPSAAAVSPDGRHIYVVGFESVLAMERDTTSGELVPFQSLKQDVLHPIRLRHVVMSPDGLNLYAGSYLDSALMVFARDPSNGHLALLQTLRYESSNWVSLVQLSDLVVSADGRFLYTAATSGSAIGIFRRNLGDGTLQPVSEVIGGTALPALQDPQSLELSSDAEHLYVADRDGGLLTFARSTDDGSLTFQNALGLDVLAPMEPIDVEMDPSGRHLYVAGLEPDIDGYGSVQSLLLTFRLEVDGNLTRIGTLEDAPGTGGLYLDESGAHLYITRGDTVTVFERSPEGQLQEIQRLGRDQGASRGGIFDEAFRYLYVPDPFRDRLYVYERDIGGGVLEQISVYDDGQDGTVDGLLDIEALHATADGTDVYTLTRENKAIAQFRRNAEGVLQPGQVLSLPDLGIHPNQPVQSWLATPDDGHLMALTRPDELWIFHRDTDTGQLTFRGQIMLDNIFPTDMAFSPDGRTLLIASVTKLLIWDFEPVTDVLTERTRLERPGQEFQAIAVDPSGRYLYAGSGLPGTSGFANIRAFRWEREPDRFTDVGTFQSPVLGDEITALQATPDGRNLMAFGEGDGAGLLVFQRDVGTGGLREIQSLVDGQDGLSGFVDPALGSMDPSGVRLVVTSTSFPTTTSTFLGRDPSNGLLEVLEQRATGDSSRPSGIDSYGGLAWSPEGRQFYAFSTISDSLFAFDESAQTACVPRPQVLCLGTAGRFRVEVEWTDFVGQQGVGTKVVESGDSGLFWFFDAANWEMLVKVVDGCTFNGHHWVFAAATTNVAYTLTVTDTLRGVEAVYRNSLGVSADAITDTEALNSCP